jgi:hypothetical protein
MKIICIRTDIKKKKDFNKKKMNLFINKEKISKIMQKHHIIKNFTTIYIIILAIITYKKIKINGRIKIRIKNL